LEGEYEAARRTGAVDVHWVECAPIDGFNTGRCLRFSRQAQFHPMRYLHGLVRAILRDGGRICTQTHVKSIAGGQPAVIETSAGPTVRAEAVVAATNTPINDRFAIHTKQAAYRTYAIGLRVPRGSITRALYWDTLDIYHYVRLQRIADGGGEHEILIVGGEDHKTGQADDGRDRFKRLEAWTRERFASAGPLEYCWSGQVMEPFDGLAFIGRNPSDKDNVFIVTGDSGMGMTHGTIAGILLSELILGRDHPWAKVYNPSRKMTGNLREFAKENINVAKEYASWVTPGEISATSELAPGEGGILRRGLTKVAAYRDESGQVIELSAVCPHLQCIVSWNSTERSWDCPCHGSRFSATGELRNGPAISGLSPVEH
jgi:glycine/D-amino acid oxidase-like deaminating enzyme/nitrite reductase/ring-hydroxylating ferredoxin subunit